MSSGEHLATGIRFLSVGALNTLAGLAVIFGVKLFFGADDIVANATGYGVGLVLSFLLNRSWTFGHDGMVAPAFFKFLLVTAVAYGLNLACVITLIEMMNVNAYLAQVAGVLPYTMASYLGSRFVVFAPTSRRTSNLP